MIRMSEPGTEWSRNHGWSLGLARACEVFGVRQDEDTWLFSPRILADMSAALVETEENWNRRPGNSLSVMPPGENLIDGTCNLLDGVGEVSVIHADDGLACLLDPGEDLLVLDLEFGVSLCLLAYDLSEGVVLT
jgi:hypothetical protein